MNLTNKKCLIAYFSRKGQNYVSGRIVDLKVGNTTVVARMIQEKTGGDMFHIETVTPIPRIIRKRRKSPGMNCYQAQAEVDRTSRKHGGI